MDSSPGIRYLTAITVSSLFATLLLIVTTTAAASIDQIEPSLISNNPFHLSWTDKQQSRHDFIFNIEAPLKQIVKLESDPANYLTSSLSACKDHSACLIKDGQFITAFKANTGQPSKTTFESNLVAVESAASNDDTSKLPSGCKKSDINLVLNHHCSTHWNPPAFLFKDKCSYHLEWHSPRTCHPNAINHERPCYTYDPKGKLVDLTPWVRSNSTSYNINLGSFNSSVSKFYLNVCNEANDRCGPNVSSCYVDEQHNHIESGYNNLSSIIYNAKDNTVVLTSLGQYDQRCGETARVKSVIRFVCKNKISPEAKPTLIRSTACEKVVEWQTIHACPLVDVKVAATKCQIAYEPASLVIDIPKLTNNQKVIETSEFELDGKRKTMKIGLCSGLPKDLECEGRSVASISACLLDASDNSTIRSSNNSQVAGSISKASIRFADDRLYYESSAVGKNCSVPTSKDFNATRQLGTRVEFYCSDKVQEKASFLGYDDCTYVFEWGSPHMCLESIATDATNTSNQTSDPKKNSTSSQTIKASTHVSTSTAAPSESPAKSPRPPNKEHQAPAERPKATPKSTSKLNPDVKHDNVTVPAKGSKSIEDQAKKSTDLPPDTSAKNQHEDGLPHVSMAPSSNRVGNFHKFIMVSAILLSLVAFVVAIFVLDKKTRLGVPLSAIRRQARQAFQPQPVPYSRVDSFNDSLDL